MTGWQRFFLLIVCIAFTLILWPQYDRAGLMFMLMAGLMWTCVIVILSVIINMFALYKLELLHRLISIVFLAALIASFLYYFPLEGGETPAARLAKGQWPTETDVRRGIKQLTFNFDFLRRGVHNEANYINQKMDDASDTVKDIKKTAKKKKEALEILVE